MGILPAWHDHGRGPSWWRLGISPPGTVSQPVGDSITPGLSVHHIPGPVPGGGRDPPPGGRDSTLYLRNAMKKWDEYDLEAFQAALDRRDRDLEEIARIRTRRLRDTVATLLELLEESPEADPMDYLTVITDHRRYLMKARTDALCRYVDAISEASPETLEWIRWKFDTEAKHHEHIAEEEETLAAFETLTLPGMEDIRAAFKIIRAARGIATS